MIPSIGSPVTLPRPAAQTASAPDSTGASTSLTYDAATEAFEKARDRVHSDPTLDRSEVRKLALLRFDLGSKLEEPIPTQPGSLVVGDCFGVDHGDEVKGAARSTGFTGQISRRALTDLADSDPIYIRDLAILNDPKSNPTDVLAAFHSSNSVVATHNLNMATRVLDDALAGGVNHSAVNFSQGVSKSGTVEKLYNKLMYASVLDDHPESYVPSTPFYRNLAAAFQLPGDAAGNPTREQFSRFKQKLIDEVSASLDSPDVAAAQARFAESVKKLAATDTTVVVSGGNEGSLLRDMAGPENTELRLPADFFHNKLAADLVIEVGMTGDLKQPDAPESVSSISSPDPSINVWANGVISGSWGTSFAAPRVAAAAAELHGRSPEASDEQVQPMIIHGLTHPLAAGNKTVPVLDPTRVTSLMNHGDFLSR